MPQTTKKPTRAISTKTKPKKKAVPEFAKPFYKKRWFGVFALILVFSSIGGGYMLRKGDAASYVFIRRAQHMAGPLREVKRDGITYKLIASIPEGNVTAKTWTFLTRDEAARSRRICVHYRVFGRDPNGPEKIDIWQTKTEGGYWVRSNSIVIPTTSDSGSVCISDPDHTDGYINVQGSFNSTVGIDTIYGNP